MLAQAPGREDKVKWIYIAPHCSFTGIQFFISLAHFPAEEGKQPDVFYNIHLPLYLSTHYPLSGNILGSEPPLNNLFFNFLHVSVVGYAQIGYLKYL